MKLAGVYNPLGKSTCFCVPVLINNQRFYTQLIDKENKIYSFQSIDIPDNILIESIPENIRREEGDDGLFSFYFTPEKEVYIGSKEVLKEILVDLLLNDFELFRSKNFLLAEIGAFLEHQYDDPIKKIVDDASHWINEYSSLPSSSKGDQITSYEESNYEDSIPNSKIQDYDYSDLRLGDTAPNFQAQTSEGEIDFYEYLGDGWGVLFSHPADYTLVSTTELGRTAQLKDEFAKRNTKIIAISVDDPDSHERWINEINKTQNTTINFPIIADPDCKVAELYGMMHPNASDSMTVRSVYIVSPDKKIKLMLTYPASTGRNFNEILRVLDSLQLTANYRVATPADWKEGENVVIIPTMPEDEISQRYSPRGRLKRRTKDSKKH